MVGVSHGIAGFAACCSPWPALQVQQAWQFSLITSSITLARSWALLLTANISFLPAVICAP
eukprot:scaffold193113_cov21-Tisochrysis_lutea.AAC.1